MEDAVVIAYIVSRWVLWMFMFLVCVILFTLFSLKKSLRRYRGWILAMTALITVYAAVPAVQGLRDIRCQSYVTVHAEYFRDQETHSIVPGSLVANDLIQITPDGWDTITLKGTRSGLPFGKHSGTVMYAQYSKVILTFLSDAED